MSTLASTEACPVSPAVLREAGMELTLVAEGTSMEPGIRAGDRLRIRCGDAAGLQPGMVICFLRDGQAVVHRLIEIDSDRALSLYEQGDAVTSGSWISHEALLGVLVAVNDQPVPSAPAWIRFFARLERRVTPWLPRWLRSSRRLALLVRATKALVHQSHARR